MGTNRLVRLLIVSILAVHASLLAWSAYRHSPVVSEVGHLPAGISHWKFGRFDLYRVNPPLVRMVAALPVMAANPVTDWSSYSTDPQRRSETSVGIDFSNANGFHTFWLYTLGRWACIPFSLIGAWVCYAWARDLYGIPSGLVAMTLWCFCPNILGNGSLIMPDVPAAALGAATCYAFWRWLKEPTWRRAALAGVVLGAAELTKTTLTVLYPLLPAMWLLYRIPDRRQVSSRAWLRETGMLAAQLLVGMHVLNLGYGFEGSGKALGEYRFKSHALAGSAPSDRRFPDGNRFADSRLASFPVPLPKNYVQGIDTQKVDFERGMRSYLRGQWSDRGWWYFYLYGLAIKVPLGTWVLVALATATSLSPRGPANRCDELCVLVPAIGIVALVSSQTGISIHFRYVIPAFGFLFVWSSKAAMVFRSAHRLLAAITAFALAWSIGSSLWYYPHSLSYFNELVGGPEHGHEHMLNSSIAWGQDLLYLKGWYDAHPEARPFHLAYSGIVNPEVAGIDFVLPRTEAAPYSDSKEGQSGHCALTPGWYVLDVNYLNGCRRPAPSPLQAPTSAAFSDVGYFRCLAPQDEVGYSLRVFHLSSGDGGFNVAGERQRDRDSRLGREAADMACQRVLPLKSVTLEYVAPCPSEE